MGTWNGNNFSVYKSDEKQVLKLIQELGTQVNLDGTELLRVGALLENMLVQTLPENVESTLNAWFLDGTLADLINLQVLENKLNIVDYNAEKVVNLNRSNLHSFDIMNYGAIGDGGLHPLSERFNTLALAQAIYPKATSLTEEIDGHALQLAIDSLPVSRYLTADIPTGGGVINIPRGTFQLSFPIKYRSAITLKGAGRFSTKLRMKDYVTHILIPEFYSGENGVRGFAMHGIGLEHGGTALNIEGLSRGIFSDISIRSCGGYGIYSDRTVDNNFKDVFIYGAGTDGIYICGNTSTMNTTGHFDGVTVVHCTGYGITISGSNFGVEGMRFENVIVEYNGHGIRVDGGLTPALTFLNTFRNVWHEGNGGYDFRIISGYETIIENSMGHMNLEGGVNTSIRNCKGNLIILASAGNRYLTGFLTGTITDPSPEKTFK